MSQRNKLSSGRIVACTHFIWSGAFATCLGQRPHFRPELNMKECIHVNMRYFYANCEVTKDLLVSIFVPFVTSNPFFLPPVGGGGEIVSLNSTEMFLLYVGTETAQPLEHDKMSYSS